MTRFRLAVAALCVTALAVTAVGTASQTKTTKTTRNEAVSGNLSIIGIWTGPEQKRFQAVLDGFEKLYPDVNVKYTSGGDNTPTILSTAIQGGNPPDLASIGQPGLLRDFANRGVLKPIAFARATAARNYTADWLKLGTVKGKLYGLFFKAANKSTVWYSTAAFRAAGVRPPATWPALLAVRPTRSGIGHARLLDRRRRRLDAHRPVREHLHPPGRAGAVRPADAPHHPLDAPDGQGRAQDDGDRCSPRTTCTAGRPARSRRTSRRPSTTCGPSRRRRRWSSKPTSCPVSRRRRRRRSRTTTCSSSRRSAALPPAVVGGGDIVVMFKDSAASQALVNYLADGGCGDDRGQVRAGLLVPEQERPAQRVRRRPQPCDGDPTGPCEDVPVRPLRPRPVGVRRDGRAGRCSSCSRTSSRAPSDVNGIAAKMEAAAKKAYK